MADDHHSRTGTSADMASDDMASDDRAADERHAPETSTGTRSADDTTDTARQLVEVAGAEIATLIRSSGSVSIEVEPTSSDSGNDMTLLLRVGDMRIRVLAPSVTISERDFARLAKEPSKLRSRFARFRRRKNLSLEELKRYALPLYWSEEWLREKFEECGTFAKVARQYSPEVLGVNATTIANYARDTFGWQVRAETTKKRHHVIDDYDTRTVTQTDLARTHGVSVSTVNRWVAAAHAAYAQAQRERETLMRDEQQRDAFVREHDISSEQLQRWLKRGSARLSESRQRQKKNHYYDQATYEKKRNQAMQRFESASGTINKVALARELGVDRSTIANWLSEFEQQR